MTIQEKFNKLWDYNIIFIQLKDSKSWRLFLTKENEPKDIYITEKKTVDECLDSAIIFIETWKVW